MCYPYGLVKSMGQNTCGKLVQSEQITGEGCDRPVGQELF